MGDAASAQGVIADLRPLPESWRRRAKAGAASVSQHHAPSPRKMPPSGMVAGERVPAVSCEANRGAFDRIVDPFSSTTTSPAAATRHIKPYASRSEGALSERQGTNCGHANCTRMQQKMRRARRARRAHLVAARHRFDSWVLMPI